MNEPLVSIFMITYNHQKFIKDAIESIMMQKLKVPFEIIIGEDCSTDGTREIVIDYSQKHPNIIKPILQRTNKGARNNQQDVFRGCKGKYIAICEGDDYWTNELKLQNQIDFLENNQHYSACTHQSMVIYEDQDIKEHPFNDLNTEMDFTINDLLGLRKFHSASVVFRSEILQYHPYLPTNITAYDRALFLLLAAYGPIRFFPFIGCVYRKNNEGISNRIKPKMLKKDLNIIPWIKQHNPQFPTNRYKAYIHKTIWQYPQKVNHFIFIKHYLLFVWYSFSYFPGNLREVKSTLRLKQV